MHILKKKTKNYPLLIHDLWVSTFDFLIGTYRFFSMFKKKINKKFLYIYTWVLNFYPVVFK